jgi:hypothetical protein
VLGSSSTAGANCQVPPGAPEFGLDWTTADKDAALPAIRNFLESNGASLHPFPSRLEEMDCRERIF